MNNRVCLISFYNAKALGIVYLENALRLAGYEVTVIFFKKFNNICPKAVSTAELDHLCALIKEQNPVAIGLSVMASLYLDTVRQVSRQLRETFPIPIVWGGVTPTMFPKESMDDADFVVRGEGEEALVELVNALNTGQPAFSQIQNLVYRDGDVIHENPLRELQTELDQYGFPTLGGSNKYLIEDDLIKNTDPGIDSYSYELTCSRGCPFACSYCCTINLRRIQTGRGRYVRFREVDKVIEELRIAKSKMKNLKFIRFWDEIFCDDAAWIDEFSARYKKEINLPFEIWGHPLRCDDHLIAKLKMAGLYKVVMGIQSGSPYIRKEVFNRPEKQEEIIAASRVLAKYKVPQVIYDFMLRHPFETHATLRETYDLCLQLALPFELQMHGLNFLPGTDIVQKAIDQNLVSPEEMERMMSAPMQEQYNMHWKREASDPVMNYIYKLIYLTQFPVYRKKLDTLSGDPTSEKNRIKLDKLYKRATYRAKLRYLYRRGVLMLKR